MEVQCEPLGLQKFRDSCDLAGSFSAVPTKCSWKRLGRVQEVALVVKIQGRKQQPLGSKGNKPSKGLPLNLHYRTKSLSAGLGVLINTLCSWKKETEEWWWGKKPILGEEQV